MMKRVGRLRGWFSWRRRLRQALASGMGIVLLAAAVLGSATPAQAVEAVISVSEAIAGNAGTATVEGYVVAHTTGTNAYDYEAPFANDFNLALSDSPSERDAAKLLPVQLTAAYRAQFGLQTNPGNIGKKVRITGELSAYFAVPGLRSPTAAEFVTGGEEPDPEPQLVTIAEARAMNGKQTIVRGVVTADNAAIGGANLSTYMQDETAGINVFSFDRDNYPELHAGDEIQVTGEIAQFRGLTEIMPVPDGIRVLQQGQALPVPQPATIAELNDAAAAESVEGELIRLDGYVQSVPGSPAGGGYNVTLIDEAYRAVTLRVMEGTQAIEAIEAGKWYAVTGIASQYDSYQVMLRSAQDLQLLDPQPEPPASAGSYESTVASITDGDTIRLSTPVLGTTAVRFLNIDTAETYHSVATEADANQKRHGEAAKAYLGTLLAPGDEIVLEVGAEPMDEYGRLLAEIVRKSDGMNVNLEMVEQGQASTYYIWPIDDSYEAYSQAVKRAHDAGIGIWNDSDPLLELPFVFRAREQQKGLLRYVGNYYTKEYVEPERWHEVPVESRVFFVSAAEAEAGGYRAEDGQPGGELVEVQLLGVNDWHGKIDLNTTLAANPGTTYGRADYLAAYLKEREAANPNTIIMHAGDMIGGSSPVSALLQDEPTVEIMEAIGFDIGTLGNHEFDEGLDELLRMIHGGEHPNGTAGYDGMDFPVVAANVVDKTSGDLAFEPYRVLESGGVRIGFIGVVTTETPQIVMPSGITSLRFTDEAEAVNRYAGELEAQGVEAIVVLAHVPGSQDGDSASGEIAALARSVNDNVDVIFAAHNHVKLDAVVDGKLIVQAWEYGNALVDVDLTIDPATGDVVAKEAEIVDIVQQGMQPDAQVASILEKYQLMVATKVEAVVGVSAADMAKGYPNKELFGDMALGNFIADGMAAAMEADVALMNGGGVRDNLNSGPVTWGELFNVQPFGNTLVKVDVTGAQLKEILNAMISPQYGPDSFIGGMRYTWDPASNHVVSLMLADGTPVDPGMTYSLVVNNFMYNQSSGKYGLIQTYGTNVEQGPEDIEATVAYARSFGTEPIDYKAEGRISTDTAAPATTAAVDGSTVAFAASDEGVGVKHIEYRVNGGEWTEGDRVNVGSGKHTVDYRAVDLVYNREAVQTINVSTDDEGPRITVEGALEAYQDERITLAVRASDAGSGVQELSATLDGGPVSIAEHQLVIDPFKLALGSHALVVTAVDHAGNRSDKRVTITVKTDIARLDEVVAAGVKRGDIDPSIAKSLGAHVEKIQKDHAKQKKDVKFNAFVHAVKAQQGKKISHAFADILLAHVEALKKG